MLRTSTESRTAEAGVPPPGFSKVGDQDLYVVDIEAWRQLGSSPASFPVGAVLALSEADGVAAKVHLVSTGLGGPCMMNLIVMSMPLSQGGNTEADMLRYLWPSITWVDEKLTRLAATAAQGRRNVLILCDGSKTAMWLSAWAMWHRLALPDDNATGADVMPIRGVDGALAWAHKTLIDRVGGSASIEQTDAEREQLAMFWNGLCVLRGPREMADALPRLNFAAEFEGSIRKGSKAATTRLLNGPDALGAVSVKGALCVAEVRGKRRVARI